MPSTQNRGASRGDASPKRFRKYAAPTTITARNSDRPSRPRHESTAVVETAIAPMAFTALGLPNWLASRLTPMGISEPTEIQASAIPVALTGVDVVGLAQTGTGKTLAFGLPMLVKLGQYDQGLVLAPTRELAAQIQETFQKLGMRTALLIGGAPMGRQVSQLRSNPKVIIATPGRLADHLSQRTINLRDVRIAVLDEADRMLDMGFIGPIREILSKTPQDRQTLLFSATFPQEIERLASEFMRDPERIEVAKQGTAIDLVTQELLVLQKDSKPEMLRKIVYEEKGTILVFSRTRHGATKLAKAMRNDGHTAAELHSDRTLAQRMSALKGFKTGEYRVMIATDIAARGIDVKGISLVVNYDVPENPEDYVHRIGRTGRAGATGRAVMLASPDQHRDVRDIEKLMGMQLAISEDSECSRPAPRTHNGRPGQGGNRPSRNRGRASGSWRGGNGR